MKLKFKHQRFQTDAAKCVTDAFLGQKYSDSAEYIMDTGKMSGIFDIQGFGNTPLMLDNSAIVDNIRAIQMRQGLKPIEKLQGDGINLTIEM